MTEIKGIRGNNCVKYFNDMVFSKIDSINQFGNIGINLSGLNYWIAGGAVRDFWMGKGVTSDIDIFTPDEKNRNTLIFKIMQAGGEQVFNNPKTTRYQLDDVVFRYC